MVTKPEALKLRDQMQSKFGAGSAMMAADMPQYPRISTGSLSLDVATGVGGWPSDRLVEVFGAEQCGKTTLGLLGMKNFLDAQPKRAAMVLDTEHKMEKAWVATLVGEQNLATRILYLQPDDIEQAIEMYKEAVRGGLICFTLFDSIASSGTRKSMETEKDEMTGNAKPMAAFSRIIANLTAKYQCCTFAVNQTRDDIEGYHRIITPGGKAPKHAAIMRVYLKRVPKTDIYEDVNGEKIRIGGAVAAKIVKNQAGGIEGRTCQYWFMNVLTEKYGFGVDQVEEISRLAVLTRSVERKGAWYNHPLLPGGKVCGADLFGEAVRANAELRAELTTSIMAKINDHVSEIAPVGNPEDLDEDLPVGELLRKGVLGDVE